MSSTTESSITSTTTLNLTGHDAPHRNRLRTHFKFKFRNASASWPTRARRSPASCDDIMTRDSPAPSPPDYKQLYDALLARLDHAAATHRAHETTLSTAQAKVKHLQAECDMLLDALAAHPSLTHVLEPESKSSKSDPAPAPRSR